MSSILNDIGMGLMGFSQGLNNGWDRQFQNEKLALMRRSADREDKGLEIQGAYRDLQRQELEEKLRQARMFEGLLPGLLGGSLPGSAPQMAPQVMPQGGGNIAPDVQKYAPQTSYWEQWYGLPQGVLPAVMHGESRGNPNAVNPTSKATGLMQIMPANFGMFGNESPTDPNANIRVGAQILSDFYKKSGGNLDEALKGYGGFVSKDPAAYIADVKSKMPSGFVPTQATQPAQGQQYAARETGTMSDAATPPVQTLPTAGLNPANYAKAAMLAKAPGVAGQVGQMLLSQYDAALKMSEHETPDQKSARALRDAGNMEKQKQAMNTPDFNPQTYFDTAKKLRDEYTGDPDTKVFNVLGQSYANIKSALKTPGREGDVALTYALMKIFDPNSVVRESEYAMAAAGRGASESVQGAIQKVMGGGALLPEERQKFAEVVDNMIAAQRKRHDVKRDWYGQRADRFKISRDDVLYPSSPDNATDGVAPETAASSFMAIQPGAGVAPAPTTPNRPPLSSFRRGE